MKTYLMLLIVVTAMCASGCGGVDADEPSAGTSPQQRIAPQLRLAREQTAAAKKLGIPVAITNSIGVQMVLIPAGEYMMGTSAREDGRRGDELQHRVRITRPFYLGSQEVTQAQYQQVMGINPSSFQDAQNPVETVSWDDALAFCEKLSALPEEKSSERVYRLPTEAEWEYACRAGSTTCYSFGQLAQPNSAHEFALELGEISRTTITRLPDGKLASLSDFAWFEGNSEGSTYPVGQKRPNAWGLWDMHGNVWEWCANWYGANYYRGSPAEDAAGPTTGPGRVFRGGAWNCWPSDCRSANRCWFQSDARNDVLGFRVATVLTVSSASGDGPTTDASPEPQAAPQEHADAEQRPTPQPQVTPEQRVAAETLRLPLMETNSIGMQMVLIPAGEFMMGSPAPEDGRKSNDQQHRVRITKPFYLGAHEVTQAQYKHLMGENPSGFRSNQNPVRVTIGRPPGGPKSDQNPVEMVSWDDAVRFCEKLSALPEEKSCDGVYRLPTEAEWEYACRAGTTTCYSFGESDSSLGDHAWFAGNSGSSTHAVGQKCANTWGLCDMHGNVGEWCADWFGDWYYQESPVDDPTGPVTGSGRVFRGGGWSFSAALCQSARRLRNQPLYHNDALGFRVAAVPAVRPANGAPPTTVMSSEQQAASQEHAGAEQPADPRQQVTPEQQAAAEKLGGPVVETNSIGMQMVLIPAGEFVMGSPETDAQGQLDERQHRVRITKSFYLGAQEVTQAQYQQVMGVNRSYFKHARNPADSVSWDDAVEFCEKLSALVEERAAGRKFRLPTEAEWEYACRAGTTTRFSFGDDPAGLANCAWFAENASGLPRPVGQKRPNAWGLYDMHGNMPEWCADWYAKDYYEKSPVDDPEGPATGSGRVTRGGGWFNTAGFRSADRYAMAPPYRYGILGFRVVAVPSASPASPTSEAEIDRR